MWLNPQFSADLVTFTKEILNGKLYPVLHQGLNLAPLIADLQNFATINFLIVYRKTDALEVDCFVLLFLKVC